MDVILDGYTRIKNRYGDKIYWAKVMLNHRPKILKKQFSRARDAIQYSMVVAQRYESLKSVETPDLASDQQ